MAQLVAAFGSSHSVMLVAELEDWIHHFPENDVKLPYFDDLGQKRAFADVLAAAPKNVGHLITPEAISERFHQAQAAMDRMRDEIAAAKLDVLVVVGDDQYELFQDELMPALGIYYGETIRNAAKPNPMPDNWYKLAQVKRLEDGAPLDYPADRKLALHLIEGLMERDFDVTALSGLKEGQYEGHAYSFLHHRYLHDTKVRMVPVFLNTYNPPNPPTPKRCLNFGKALGELIANYPEDCRVGVMASGGLSHFVVNEAMDRAVLSALRKKDLEYFARMDPRQLKAGTSEIRCWIVLAGAMGGLNVYWESYVPGYRTEALTGTGLGFAALR
jgi:Catalytic LigB subunit of aromatic ring-opening dioxygenase